MKKMVCSLVAGAFLIAGTVHATEPVVIEEAVNTNNLTSLNDKKSMIESDITTETDFDLFEFVTVFQSTLVDLTDSEKERLRLLLEFVTNTNVQLENLLLEEQFEQAAILFEKYNQDLEYINKLIEKEQQGKEELEEMNEEDAAIDEEELLSDIDIVEELTEKTSMRGVNLKALLERDDLPDQAKAGITKALANQERADANRQRAKDRKEQRKAEKENRKSSEEESFEELVDQEEEATTSTKDVKEHKQKSKNESAEKGKEKAEQGQKLGHEAKEQGQSRGQETKEKAQQRGPGNSNGNGNAGRP